MSRSKSIALLLFVGIAGCKSVQPRDLAGTWVISDASRQVLPPELKTDLAKIVLNRDGTFVASAMPGLFYFPQSRPARLESGNGAWELVSREGKQQIQLVFHAIADWNTTDLPYGTPLEVSRGWSAMSLYYFIGDPDEGRRIEFERK